jgi:polysaccharide export outer membrane protein
MLRISFRLTRKVLLRCMLLIPSGASIAAQAQVAPESSITGELPCSRYPLGPLDQIAVRSLNGEKINETVTVGGDGTITLPLVGRLVASGLTSEDLQRRLNTELKPYVREPNVAVSIVTAQSRHISVLGAVNQPGVHVIRGCSHLIDAISRAGGLRQDAGNSIKVTRTAASATGGAANYRIIDISISDLIQAQKPEANIVVEPEDVISIPRGQLVYVVGAVQKAGGFVLNERDTMSVLQALSLAGGLGATPAPQNARILRGSNEKRKEIAVDVRNILDGKHADVALLPDDILFIPSSTSKKVAIRTLEAVIQTATGLVIWRR